jgi:hypothetical protein
MTQNELTITPVASIGEVISIDQARTFILDYANSFPNDVTTYTIGRNIISDILAQPGCDGVRFYNALNEFGEKTLVYVGIDKHQNPLISFIEVSKTGAIETSKGIVADRVRTGAGVPSTDLEGWSLEMPI